MDFSLVIARTYNNVCMHIAIITETKSTYVMLKPALWLMT